MVRMNQQGMGVLSQVGGSELIPSALPLMNEKRFSPSKLKVLVDVLGDAGVPPEFVLSGTGLDVASIADPFTLTSSDQFLSAARNAVRLCQSVDLGLQVGRRLHATSYSMYGYALLCATSLAQVFETAVKYHPLANGMLRICWMKEQGAASWCFPDRASITLANVDARLFRFLIDLQFAVHVTIIKDVMGSWCIPAKATFAEPEPPHATLLSEALECPVYFNQPKNMLSYPAEWLNQPPTLANPITAAQVATYCARLLEETRTHANISTLVRKALTRSPGTFPDIQAIAQSMCMTSRTLRRKLEEEGTSYSHLLSDIRQSTAIEYLTKTTLSAEEMAVKLGFSDAVSFRHAFKRWTGSTPNEFRREQAAVGVNAERLYRGHTRRR
jgi:AraC-like DNA-binding protein